MRQLFLKKGAILLQDVPIPELDKKSILVRVHYSFISSGTELATVGLSEKSLFSKVKSDFVGNAEKIIGAVKDNGVSGTYALLKEKLEGVNALGYSCSGQVVAVGSEVEKFKIGDFVACAGSGYANHADIVSVPSNLAVKIKNNKFLKHASLTTIGAVALQGIRRAKLNLGEKVCIIGLGLIGQITIQLAKLAGCQVFGIDLLQNRLKLAQELGADFVCNSDNNNLLQEIAFITNHYGVDTTIITAASNSGVIINQAMNLTRRKGKVVLVGDVKLDFDRSVFYSKEIDFLISCSYGPGRYDSSYEVVGNDYPYAYVRWTENRNMEFFVDLLESKKILVEPLISQEFLFDQAENAYSFLKKEKALGVVLSYVPDLSKDKLQNIAQELTRKTYDELNFDEENKNFKAPAYIATKEKIKVGFIGVGGFAKVKLLPIISGIRKSEITSAVDVNSMNLLNMAKVYAIKNIGSNYKKMLTGDDVNLVIIATPHKFHMQQTIEALRVGKAVFLEKPAAVNFVQLKTLQDFFRTNKDCLFCVDFNRSFAPFNITIKKELIKRKNPIMINYRMNAGFIPKDHWIQDAQNGGRLIGEACHIFELFCFLTEANPVSVAVQAIHPGSNDLSCNDNVIVSLSMSDGSCCSLIYSALGSNSMGKERMEIYFEGKSIIMQDYSRLNGYGMPVWFNKKAIYQDKGHENLINQFFVAARTVGAKSPIPIERILNATKVSLIADKLARQGGGIEYLE